MLREFYRPANSEGRALRLGATFSVPSVFHFIFIIHFILFFNIPRSLFCAPKFHWWRSRNFSAARAMSSVAVSGVRIAMRLKTAEPRSYTPGRQTRRVCYTSSAFCKDSFERISSTVNYYRKNEYMNSRGKRPSGNILLVSAHSGWDTP